MNPTSPARRFLQALAVLAVASVTGFAFGVALDALALPLFSAAACVFPVLILASEYAPRASYLTERFSPAAAYLARRERMPLAA